MGSGAHSGYTPDMERIEPRLAAQVYGLFAELRIDRRDFVLTVEERMAGDSTQAWIVINGTKTSFRWQHPDDHHAPVELRKSLMAAGFGRTRR